MIYRAVLLGEEILKPFQDGLWGIFGHSASNGFSVPTGDSFERSVRVYSTEEGQGVVRFRGSDGWGRAEQYLKHQVAVVIYGQRADAAITSDVLSRYMEL